MIELDVKDGVFVSLPGGQQPPRIGLPEMNLVQAGGG